MYRVKGIGSVALVCGLLFLSQSASADGDDALKKKILALNTVTGEGPIKGRIKMLVEDAAASKKMLAQAVVMAKEKPQPFTYNAAYILARTAQGLKDLEAGRTFYKICIDQAVKLVSGQKLAQSYDGYLTLLIQFKKMDEVIAVSQEFLELPIEGAAMKPVRDLQNGVLVEMLIAMARNNQFDTAIKMVEGMMKRDPDNWKILVLKAEVEREAGKFEAAAKSIESLLEHAAKSKDGKEEKTELLNRYRYMLSGIYIDLNNVDKATDILKKLLDENPNSPTYNNDLGYIWADNNKNLDESEKMIRKALEEDRKQRKDRKGEDAVQSEDDKDSSAYLDSLGWVLYRKKNYAEAKKYLLQAVKEEEGQHIEILDHLADVHMALGEKKEAIAVWKKALESEANTRREKAKRAEVEKKLGKAEK